MRNDLVEKFTKVFLDNINYIIKVHVYYTYFGAA
jgi:hypothetical protein